MSIYIMFKYKEIPLCNFLSEDTNGFEVSIENCDKFNLKYRTFDFKDRNTLEFKMYTISMEAIAKIQDVINNNKEIFDVNSQLDNGSQDGSGHEFWFSNCQRNREILAWNIAISTDNGNEMPEKYLEQYGDNLKQERLVLKVFFEISNILKDEGITLELYKFIGNEELEYKTQEKEISIQKWLDDLNN